MGADQGRGRGYAAGRKVCEECVIGRKKERKKVERESGRGYLEDIIFLFGEVKW